jgi:hypothetical protein
MSPWALMGRGSRLSHPEFVQTNALPLSGAISDELQ